MTLIVHPPVVAGAAVDDDLVAVARAVHEEFDTRLEPTLVDECIHEVAARFADARVRSFVPLLVRRYATDALRDRVASAR
ncbi:three-helix bundle dimerization domain-containing protein [Angustibacter sp. McL0619]|uniref:three-helix bundle dimerization domain-containing protein n=1 Tax=Angustibacter sp. McL0619 TaxID=3415676 RepID=UPI003CE91076